jgi:CRP/FNR family transcriptional regulator
VDVRPREVLFHAGDAGDGCHFVRSGAVKVSVIARDGQERLLAVLGPGSLIGELALIDDEPRSATVTALRRCQMPPLPDDPVRLELQLPSEHPQPKGA